MHLKKILVFYDHFYPAWKAGGPVQSIANLVRLLGGGYQFFIVCKPHEMGEHTPLAGIMANEWNNWEGMASVYYRTYSNGARQPLAALIDAVAPDVIFINGLFSLHFNLLPLRAALNYAGKHQRVKVIVSARGMLHPGALSQKPLKKQLFLQLFKLLGWHRKVCWHATDTEELGYIHQVFGTAIRGGVAGNFPNLLPCAAHPAKQPGQLVMATIALVSPMKNHLLVLKALQRVKARVQWYIYGPLKDPDYWQQCTSVIRQLPAHIQVVYQGPVEPSQVQQVMQQFQLFIMPSKSENFGHALLEALSAGKPVITTTTTPFAALNAAGAGIAIAPEALPQQLSDAIEQYAAMDAAGWQDATARATAFASDFVDTALLQQQYNALFETH